MSQEGKVERKVQMGLNLCVCGQNSGNFEVLEATCQVGVILTGNIGARAYEGSRNG